MTETRTFDVTVDGTTIAVLFRRSGADWVNVDPVTVPGPVAPVEVRVDPTMDLTDGPGAEAPTVTVYTDGSQRANGDGGWAWWASPGAFDSGAEKFTTNQVMELWAVIEAIAAFNPDVPLRIVSDSSYVVNCFLERWFDRWRNLGWRNPKGHAVANREVWEELLANVEAHRAPIEWVHIRGHGKVNSAGERPDPQHVHGNDQADRLATAASASLSV